MDGSAPFRIRSDNPGPSPRSAVRLQSCFSPYSTSGTLLLQQEQDPLAGSNDSLTREISSYSYGASRLWGRDPRTDPLYPLSARRMQPTSADAGLDSKHCHRQGE
jgi:hypothetical protein